MKFLLSWVLLLAVSFPSTAIATSLSCKNKLIRVGDSSEFVLIHCGAPNFVERETRQFPQGGTLGERCFHANVNIERWSFKRSGGRPIVVTVVESKVERIRPNVNGFDRSWKSPC